MNKPFESANIGVPVNDAEPVAAVAAPPKIEEPAIPMETQRLIQRALMSAMKTQVETADSLKPEQKERLQNGNLLSVKISQGKEPVVKISLSNKANAVEKDWFSQMIKKNSGQGSQLHAMRNNAKVEIVHMDDQFGQNSLLITGRPTLGQYPPPDASGKYMGPEVVATPLENLMEAVGGMLSPVMKKRFVEHAAKSADVQR